MALGYCWLVSCQFTTLAEFTILTSGNWTQTDLPSALSKIIDAVRELLIMCVVSVHARNSNKLGMVSVILILRRWRQEDLSSV